jgi:hypothetical protein
MIAHVVLFAPRPDLAAADRRALIVAFERAVREIPSVRGFRVGRRVTHGAGYEQRSSPAVDFFVVVDFDDLAGLQTYLRHPAHEELGARFAQSVSSAWVYDFDADGLEGLQPGGLP